jgi:crotonobetaine/carnitine-CoA ligase
MADPEALSFAGVVARRAEVRPDDEVVRLAASPGWSAADLWQRSLAIAGGLADHIDAGDAVATCLPPGPEAIAVTAALSALGAVEMPLGECTAAPQTEPPKRG